MSIAHTKKKEEGRIPNCTIPNLYDEFHQELTFNFERFAVQRGSGITRKVPDI